MLSFKNKQGTIYIDTYREDGFYIVTAYDFILLRDVDKKFFKSKKSALVYAEKLKNIYHCFIEI